MTGHAVKFIEKNLKQKKTVFFLQFSFLFGDVCVVWCVLVAPFRVCSKNGNETVWASASE